MGRLSYLNFDLALARRGEGYVARLVASPVGEAEHGFTWPFDDRDVELLVLTAGRPRTGVRRFGSPEMQRARTFGRRLYEAVFGGAVGTALLRSLDAAERDGARLRIRLRLGEVPELAAVPWEFLYVDDLGRFLVVSLDTPLVRYLDLARTPRPLSVASPLQVVALLAAPVGVPALDVEQEAGNLVDAVASLVEDGRVTLERLAAGTTEALQERLRRGDAHVLHIIGHGAFDEGSGEGVLALETAKKQLRRVTATDLVTLLHDHHELRLVVLNSCEGARSGPADPFGGVAQALVRQGIPAVVAMQFEITDEAAVVFSRALYRAVADGYPIDAAVSEGRKALFAAGNDVEWATPVLFLRAPDGRLFDVARTSPVAHAGHGPGEGPSGSPAPPSSGVPAREDAGPPGGDSVEPVVPGRASRLLAGLPRLLVGLVVLLAGGLAAWQLTRMPDDDGGASDVPDGAVAVQSACLDSELVGHVGPARRDGRLVRLPVRLENVDDAADFLVYGIEHVRDQDGSSLAVNRGELANEVTLQPDDVLTTEVSVTPGGVGIESLTVEFNLECESFDTSPVPVPP